MNSAEMKNIKKPAYAVAMGNGLFAGTTWMCTKCGKQVITSYTPTPQSGGRCPDTASGNHVWKQI